MKKRKKGFTMVELLVTIIILGILTTLAYFGVSTILNRGSNSYYDSQENMLILAGREYFADYREKLPKDIGKTASVTLDTLIKESYIDPVKDEDDNDCNRDKTTVTVQKITDKDYQYYVTLVCDYYETKEDTAKPVITFSPNKQSTTKTITVKMEVTDNKDVASYRYVITKDGEEYKDSEYQNYTGKVTIKLTEKGLYEIVGYAYDTSGNRSSERSGKYSIYVGIDCSQVEFDSDIKVRTWTNKNISVTMKLPDNTYRWELSRRVNGGEYTSVDNYIGAASRKLTFNTEGKHQLKLVLYDRDGNSCIATTGEYYIDKTKPSCTSSGGSSAWRNKDLIIKGTCSDKGGSGCTGNVSKKYTSNTNTTKVSPGTVKDKAGNSTTCPANQTVKIDKTKPTCTSSGGSTAWTNGTRTLKGTCSDKGGSGCTGNVTKTYSTNTNKTNLSPGTVKDHAGNTTKCPANQTVRIDKTAPTCKSSGGSTAWTTGSRTLIGTCSDKGGSGCVGNVSKKIDYETNQTNLSPGTVKDKAGNSTVCPANQTVRIDRTAPSCPSFSATIGEKTWTNKDITYTFGFTSDTTKWRWYTGTEGGSWTDWGEKPVSTKKVSISGEGKRTIKLRVYDSVGNSRECFSDKVYYIDKTNPTLSVVLKKKNNSTDLNSSSNISSLENYSNNTWYSGYVVARASCTDDSGSCSISYQVTGASTNTNGYVNGNTRNINAEGTSYITFKATDAAGNTVTKSYTIKLDRSMPTPGINFKNVCSSSCTNNSGTSYSAVTCNITVSYTGTSWSFTTTEKDNSGGSGYAHWYAYFKGTSGSGCKDNGKGLDWNKWYKDSSGYFGKQGCTKGVYKVKNEDKAGNQSKELTINITYSSNCG